MIKAENQKYARYWSQAAERRTGLKESARALARRSVLDLVSRWPQRDEHMLKCLCLHYVFEDQIEAFKEFIEALESVGNFVSADEAMGILDGTRPLQGRNFLLTFDDGFKNVVENGFPLLQSKRIPAVFFVPTAYIGGDLTRSTKFADQENYRAPIEMCSWEDLRSLDQRLFTIGAHTRTHRVLADFGNDRQQLLDELQGSKQDIEKHLERTCDYFAWPRGKMKYTSELALKLCEEVGFSGCFGVFPGSVTPKKTNPLAIPRQNIDVHWPLAHSRYLALRHR